jgi:Carboxypeptidase regulatory-like domain
MRTVSRRDISHFRIVQASVRGCRLSLNITRAALCPTGGTMRTIRCAIISGIVALAVSSAPSVTAQSRGLGRLNGTITSEAGEPIVGAGVRVEIGSEAVEGKSDVAGKWAVTGLGKGQFVAEFSKAGFETKRVRLVIEKEMMQSEPIKIALKKSA